MAVPWWDSLQWEYTCDRCGGVGVSRRILHGNGFIIHRDYRVCEANLLKQRVEREVNEEYVKRLEAAGMV